MNEEHNSKDTFLDKEALDTVEGEISELTKKLSEAKQKRNQLTAKTEIDFTISTIHPERAPLVIVKAMKIDRTKSYSQFKEEWKKSIADEHAVMFGARVGTITGRGSRERLVSVMHKIAKHGGTIIVEDAFAEQIPIPPPNIWWDPDEAYREAQRDLEREDKKKEAK